MLWRWRKLLTATLVALCLAFVVASISSSGRVTPVEIMVAGRDMPAGHTVTESDIAWTSAPSGTIPGELLLNDVEGQRLAVGIPSGTPLTQSMLVGPTLADSAPDGTIVLPLYLSSPREMTPVGSSVDLWATDEVGTAYKASTAATIMAFSDESSDPDLTHAYVAVSAEEATLVLGTSTQSPLVAVLHP